MSDDADVHYYDRYYPPGVKDVIAVGGSAWIGEVDETTVLKYPLARGGDMTRLDAEKKILSIVSPHPRIIGLKGASDTGIYLERAANGTLYYHYLESGQPPPKLQQRLSWCREAAEAVAYIHSKRVIHCDIQPSNLLLDQEFHLKLSDFQGKLLSEDEEVLEDGWSSESCRFSCPREDICYNNIKTDIFALGSCIYFIMMGHDVFPDIISGQDGWHERVGERFAKQQFPQDTHVCSAITLKCWKQQYESAEEIVQEIKSIEKN